MPIVLLVEQNLFGSLFVWFALIGQGASRPSKKSTEAEGIEAPFQIKREALEDHSPQANDGRGDCGDPLGTNKENAPGAATELTHPAPMPRARD